MKWTIIKNQPLPKQTNKTKKTYINKNGEKKVYEYKGAKPVKALYFWKDENKKVVYVGTSSNIQKKFRRYTTTWDQKRWAEERPIFKWLKEQKEQSKTIYFNWIEHDGTMEELYLAEEFNVYSINPELNMTTDGQGGRPKLQITEDRIKDYKTRGWN